MPLNLTRDELIRSQNFIAGRWCDGLAADVLAVVNPADESLITNVPDSAAADAQAAVDAAQAAFPAWRATPAKQRAQLLKRWNDLIIEHQEDLGRSSRASRASRWPKAGAKCSTPRATSSGSPKRQPAPMAT